MRSSVLGTTTPRRDLVGLKEADDYEIWNWASENGYVVVTADADFVEMAGRLASGPKIVHIPRFDFRFRVIEKLLGQNVVRIAVFEKDAEQRLLVLQV